MSPAKSNKEQLPVNSKDDDEDAAAKKETEAKEFKKFAYNYTLSGQGPIDLKGKKSKDEDYIHSKEVSVNDIRIVDIAPLAVTDENEEGWQVRYNSENENNNYNGSISTVWSNSFSLNMCNLVLDLSF